MFLIDTSVLSETSRREPDPAVQAWLDLQPVIRVSAMTIFELEFGVASAPRGREGVLREWLDGWLEDTRFVVLDVTQAASTTAGQLAGAARRAGRTLGDADVIIAATAFEHGLVVATRNVADFQGLGVAVVNPFEAP